MATLTLHGFHQHTDLEPSALWPPLNQKQDKKTNFWKFSNRYNDEGMQRTPQCVHTSTEVMDFLYAYKTQIWQCHVHV